MRTTYRSSCGLLAIAVAALLAGAAATHAASSHHWPPHEQKVINWYEWLLKRYLSGFKTWPWHPIRYVYNMVGFRHPYCIVNGLDYGVGHVGFVEKYGVGNCSDMAMFVQKYYTIRFVKKASVKAERTGRGSVPLRPIVVIRGATETPVLHAGRLVSDKLANKLPLGRFCHGSAVVVPTWQGELVMVDKLGYDKNNKLVKTKELPNYDNIFGVRDPTESVFFDVASLADPDDKSAADYQRMLKAAKGKLDAWRNALVLDGWRKSYMPFKEWGRKTKVLIAMDHLHPMQAQHQKPIVYTIDRFTMVTIGVGEKDAGNWNNDFIMQYAAYSHGCRVGHRVRYLWERYRKTHKQKVRALLEKEGAKWEGYGRIVTTAFKTGVEDAENTRIDPKAMDKNKIDMLNKIEFDLDKAEKPKARDARVGKKIQMQKLFPGTFARYRDTAKERLEAAGAKDFDLTLHYYWEIIPRERMLLQQMPKVVAGDIKESVSKLTGYHEADELSKQAVEFKKEGVYTLKCGMVLHCEGPVFEGKWGEVLAKAAYQCPINVRTGAMGTPISIKSVGPYPFKTLGLHRYAANFTNLGVTLTRSPKNDEPVDVVLAASPGGYVKFDKTRFTIAYPNSSGKVGLRPRKAPKDAWGTKKITITAQIAGTATKATCTVDYSTGHVDPAWKKRREQEKKTYGDYF